MNTRTDATDTAITVTPSAEEGIYFTKKDESIVKVCCDTCPYFTDRLRIYGTVKGECHRNAPIPGSGHHLTWPRVESTDWCGEHPLFVK